MSALEQFINDQKKKGSGISGSASFSSLDSLRNKLPTSIGGFSLLSRSETTDSQQLLVGDDSGDGQLPTSRNRKNSGWFTSSTQDESMFGMTRTQRVIAFFMCIIGAIFCFSTAAVLIPVILVSTRKFAALNTLGSVLMLLSFAFLLGPKSYLTHMASPQRRLVTVSYVSALFATLYSSLWTLSIDCNTSSSGIRRQGKRRGEMNESTRHWNVRRLIDRLGLSIACHTYFY
ncbi:hypothetical protein B9Z55_005528 [Caenorhabditis nigoni]|uniref:Vesicle transport protein n=1 Tax=Caenorhabditis nigoni TaxID=1611254 RepID=A0A2G5V1C4_9PELO|nr:hypothetical protein B9Z55_005528 [Caenorhabditis nigoni]